MLPRTHHRIEVDVNLRRTAAAWLFAGIAWFALEAIAASAFPGYSYARNYISDLGDPIREAFDGRQIDSRLAWVMNCDLVAHGVAFSVGAFFAFRASKRGSSRYVFMALVALNAIGSTTVALVHSTNAAIADATFGWHELGALVSIVAGNLAIVLAGFCAGRLGASAFYRAGSIFIGLAGVASFIILVGFAKETHLGSGIWERGSVYAIMSWELLTGVLLVAARRNRKGVMANHA